MRHNAKLVVVNRIHIWECKRCKVRWLPEQDTARMKEKCPGRQQ